MSLEIRELVAGYDDVKVIRGVSLEVGKGRIVTLLGANGAGKTTTLNAICGLGARVYAGDVLLDGESVAAAASHERVAAGLVHIPQGRQLFPFMSVRENLEMGAYAPGGRASRGRNLEWVTSIFPVLKERMHQLAGSLSGGEQQMCAIARGLMSNPRYLLIDEPSLGLAPIIVKQVIGVLDAIARKNIGILLVEQNVAMALKIARYGYVLEQNCIVLQGPAESLAADDRVRKAYLGL